MTDKPLPQVDPESQPYWNAAREGRLLIKRCADCGKAHHYPRELCPHCHSDRVTWEQASGKGTVYTYTVARRPAGPAFKADTPYVVALVELAEGPRMMTNLVSVDLERVRIGLPVQVRFEAISDEISLPKFMPA
ncbi:MAG: Zn-ribbon domain-containing OB-fold protein [Panacagrimonas sp.]